MINKTRVALIIKTVKSKKRLTGIPIYLSILSFSIFVAYSFCLVIETSPIIKIIYKGSLIFIINFLVLSGVYYIVNEIIKYESVNAVKSAISNLRFENWEWISIALVDRPIRLHHDVMTHPITMIIIGVLFLKEGYTHEGDVLIEKARNVDPALSKISFDSSIREGDIQYLYDTLTTGKAFVKANFFRQLWGIKAVRYSLLVLFGLFILLHFLVQIASVHP